MDEIYSIWDHCRDERTRLRSLQVMSNVRWPSASRLTCLLNELICRHHSDENNTFVSIHLTIEKANINWTSKVFSHIQPSRKSKMRMQTHACTQAHTQAYTHTHTHTHTNSSTNVCVHIHTHADTCMHTYPHCYTTIIYIIYNSYTIWWYAHPPHPLPSPPLIFLKQFSSSNPVVFPLPDFQQSGTLPVSHWPARCAVNTFLTAVVTLVSLWGVQTSWCPIFPAYITTRISSLKCCRILCGTSSKRKTEQTRERWRQEIGRADSVWNNIAHKRLNEHEKDKDRGEKKHGCTVAGRIAKKTPQQQPTNHTASIRHNTQEPSERSLTQCSIHVIHTNVKTKPTLTILIRHYADK